MDPTEPTSMPIEFRHKEKCIPESLLCLCLKYVVHNLKIICLETPEAYTLHEKLILPEQICDKLIEMYQSNGFEFSDNFAHLFKDTTRTRLSSVHLNNSKLVTDVGLEYLLRHDLKKITLTNCPKISHKAYTNMFERDSNLSSITIRPNKKITPYYDFSSCLQTSEITNSKKAPNLKHLVLESVDKSPESIDNKYISATLDNLSQLRILDLTYCSGVGSLQYLSKLTSIRSLILFDVDNLQENNAISSICSLKSLVDLDISQNHERFYENEDTVLAQIVISLPNLKALDISGTNLAGKGRSLNSMYESLSGKKSDIPGLEYRVDNPLEFLGLYGTKHGACHRKNIPAKRISGNANEEQLFNAASSSMGKLRFMKNIIFDFHRIFMKQQCTKIDQASDIVLEILDRFVDDKIIQLCGCATVYCILRNKDLPFLNDTTVKRRIVTALLTAINENPQYTPYILRNVCLSLFEMRIPQDVMFEFNRLSKILLNFIFTPYYDAHDHGFHMINSLVSEANKEQKNEIGDAGAIKIMIGVVKQYLNRRQCNCELVGAWSTMQNITAESPKNCERFMNENGLKYLIKCLKSFPHESILKWHMFRLLNNVAQVKNLRPRLMKTYYVKTISRFLFSFDYDMEISYNAVGIIAYLASDGRKAWTIRTPFRYRILYRMKIAIQNWNLDVDLDVNYCSFESILELAQIRHTPHCIYFAVWTLANLTKKFPQKYCSIVIAEGGLKIIKELLKDYHILNPNYLSGVIYSLAQTVIKQCLMYQYIKNTVEESSK